MQPENGMWRYRFIETLMILVIIITVLPWILIPLYWREIDVLTQKCADKIGTTKETLQFMLVMTSMVLMFLRFILARVRRRKAEAFRKKVLETLPLE